ncbi:hypothetical protein C6T71_01685 [Burkholderia multivorans]|nr:hypothetical protein C6T71_01685 [Burkholderia multivorans]
MYGIVRLCRAAFGRVARVHAFARSLCCTSAAGDALWSHALAVIRSLPARDRRSHPVGAVVSARAFCRQIRRPRLTSFHPNLE